MDQRIFPAYSRRQQASATLAQEFPVSSVAARLSLLIKPWPSRRRAAAASATHIRSRRLADQRAEGGRINGLALV